MKKIEYMLYSLIIAVISTFLWAFAKSFAMPIIMVLCAGTLLFKNDLKFGLPYFVNFLFVNGVVAASTNIDIGLIVGGVALIAVIIVYIIRNRLKFHLGKFGLNLAILAILAILPVFWGNIQSSAFYFLYLGWLAYFVVYLFFTNSIREDIKGEFSYAMEGLSILLALEGIISVVRILVSGGSLKDIYSLGWGICNEAGIMLCVAVPFVFYQFFSKIKSKEAIYHFCVLILSAVGILATLSRGTIMFAVIEYGLLILYMLLKKKLYKLTAVLVGVGIIVIGGISVWKFDFIFNHLIDFIDDNGRFSLYNKALSAINERPLNMIFGAGFAFAVDFKDAVFVCHSTIYETLVCMGVVGMVAMLFHFAIKYRVTLQKHNDFNNMLLIGFIVVDIYGLIDNTYHMYYFMIILVMILAVLEKSNEYEVIE